MKIQINRVLRVTAVVLLFFPAFYSCKKDAPTKGVVTVLDSNNAPVAGALVTVFQDSVTNQITGVRADIRDVKVSDSAGKTEHTFKWEAFLNIEAIRANGADTARGYIRLEYQKTIEATVRFH
ncbi:MAG: hypothetical protein JJE25_09665 [Bacteroidia bacterium]|nr:hypothetical protein [Bacteroidia bacterium]